jgi:UDP-2,3-diacylglucosamine hydrolase
MAGAATAPRPLPAHSELNAPDHWQAVDFISDLHLCQTMPRTFAAWSAHMRHTPADAVFILGDLFELWVGDDSRTRPFEHSCLEVIADAAKRLQVAFMVGNRDFLVGAAMLRDAGLLGLADPTVFSAWGRRILLSHGDALCLDDHSYQAFRSEVRAAAWQASFLARPLAERMQLAAQLRSVSATRQRYDGDTRVDVDAAEALRWMRAMGAADLVHGHTHRPGSNPLASGFERHVLSDWDLDGGQRAEVLRLSRKGFERVAPALGDTPQPSRVGPD